MSKLTPAVAAALITLSACSSSSGVRTGAEEQSTAPVTVVLASEVDWEQLNPARGDKSPQAGTLWGDRKGTGPTGFLLKPVDGFKSPPHIHNVSDSRVDWQPSTQGKGHR